MERTKQIIADITSQDEHKVWLALCEIIQCGQNRDIILPLIEYLPKIKSVKLMGGTIARHQRFINLAIKTIEFYRDSNDCPCELYRSKGYGLFNPKKEAEKGNIKIYKEVVSAKFHSTYYLTECLKCGANFKISEIEYHFTLWEWEGINV